MDETEIVYNVSVPRMSRNAAILIGFGVLVYFVSKSDFHACFANQPCDPRVMIAFPGSFILVVMGLLAIFGAFKQLPRLTLSADGVVYQSLYKTRQVSWEHLGPFQRVVPNKATLRAAVMEPLAPGMMAPPRPLVIMPSIFGKKIGFEDELNEHRRRFTPGAVPVRLGAASVPGAEPSVEVLRGWDVLWRGFIVFVSQWLLLLAAGAVMVIAILASKAMSGGPPPDPVKIFTVSLLGLAYLCGQLLRSRKFRPNKAAATMGMLAFVASALPTVGLHLGDRISTHVIVGIEILLIPIGLCLGLSGWRRRSFF